MNNKFNLSIGSNIDDTGNIHFRVWAPKADSLCLVVKKGNSESVFPMERAQDDYFNLTMPNQDETIDYVYRINGSDYSDPASRWQPHGVHGVSRVYNPKNFTWSDNRWKGIPLEDYIIYELHVGTFSEKGTFEGVIEKLSYLKDLGITAIEIMPVAEFPGSRNWGYDGVYPFAPHHQYGGPDELKRLINACHEEGLAVVLDVVYNHLGPEGNYLEKFGYYFTDQYKTPWGPAINYDGKFSDHVRHYFISNALYWLSEYHVDALRLDAVHAIYDFSPKHILRELKENFDQLAKALDRQVYLIAESDLNDSKIINPPEKGGYGLDAQWNDDIHHVIYSLLTGSKKNYFADFDSLEQLAKGLTHGFIYDGQFSKYRKRRFGNSSKENPGKQFVICIENHDQIGNASLGKRLGNLISQEKYLLASIILLTSPFIPLIFMGQEWMASSPFSFFASFEDPVLSKNVTEGYKKEFQLSQEEGSLVDPQHPDRFFSAKLKWNELSQDQHSKVLTWYKQLISLRKQLKPLRNCRKDLTVSFADQSKNLLLLERKDNPHHRIFMILNFSDKTQKVNLESTRGLELKLSLKTDNNNFDLNNLTIQPYDALIFTER